jgi:hypothetical protein
VESLFVEFAQEGKAACIGWAMLFIFELDQSAYETLVQTYKQLPSAVTGRLSLLRARCSGG